MLVTKLDERIMKRFHNRTVIVTGGARGMGASKARGFVAEGANVMTADVHSGAGVGAERSTKLWPIDNLFPLSTQLFLSTNCKE